MKQWSLWSFIRPETLKKIAFDPIIRGLCPDSVYVLLKINHVKLHRKNRNTGESYFCMSMLVKKQNQVANLQAFTREIMRES